MCHPDLLEPLPAGPEELPDEFFEVTVDDVRKRLAQLQSERQVLLVSEGAPSPFVEQSDAAHPELAAISG